MDIKIVNNFYLEFRQSEAREHSIVAATAVWMGFWQACAAVREGKRCRQLPDILSTNTGSATAYRNLKSDETIDR
jgi:hypothetical protein